MLISHNLNYPSIPSQSRASWSALGLGGCQLRAGARCPKCGQSFVSLSHPRRVSRGVGGRWVQHWAGPSGEQIPQAALAQPGPGHPPGSWSRAGLGGGGRGRHWAFVPCSPRGPAQKPVPTLAPGCTLPSWERKEFRLESGVQPVPWLRGFLGKFPGASPSWL